MRVAIHVLDVSFVERERKMHRDPVGNQTRDLRLLVGRFGVWFQAVSLWIFLSLQSLHQLVPAYIEPSHQATCAGDAS